MLPGHYTCPLIDDFCKYVTKDIILLPRLMLLHKAGQIDLYQNDYGQDIGIVEIDIPHWSPWQ